MNEVTRFVRPARWLAVAVLLLSAVAVPAAGSAVFAGTTPGVAGATPTPTPCPCGETPTPTPFPVTATGTAAVTTPWFNEEDVKVTSGVPLSALTVTIVVQRTTGVSFSGMYNTVGGQTTQSSSTGSTITYTFSLGAGQTLGAGSWTFAAQTSGSGTAHPTGADTFTVVFTVDGPMGFAGGHF